MPGRTGQSGTTLHTQRPFWQPVVCVRERNETRKTRNAKRCASVAGHSNCETKTNLSQHNSCLSRAHCFSFQPFKIYKLLATLSQTRLLANSSSSVFVFACIFYTATQTVRYGTIRYGTARYGTLLWRNGQWWLGRGGMVDLITSPCMYCSESIVQLCLYICAFVCKWKCTCNRVNSFLCILFCLQRC